MIPQQTVQSLEQISIPQSSGQQQYSRIAPTETEFRQLIGDDHEGMVARFLENKLNLLLWYRPTSHSNVIFGAQIDIQRLTESLQKLLVLQASLREEICVALLNDSVRPVAKSRPDFQANWKRPFVATEIGEELPHWEFAVYLLNPHQLNQTAQTLRLTLSLLITVLLLTIGIGGWLIVRNLNAELILARRKTDFVSNVSHELKTPLTSIRMFSELLAEGRVADSAKQKSYLHIISTEASRLTRLINDVLDFSRLESGEKKYHFKPCDVVEVVRTATEMFRPHLEASGFKLICAVSETKIPVSGDADALSQIMVNLLSNAEKYSSQQREIIVQVEQKNAPLPQAEIKVLDRGSGVPRGSGKKIFEKFYRAHDSLSSGIQGSGLGLTIAQQIARAHGGELSYEPREGGGSCFTFRIPINAG